MTVASFPPLQPSTENSDPSGAPLDWTSDSLRRRARVSLGAAQRAHVGREGPAVLRLRMLELAHALRMGAIDQQARAEAGVALADLREAVLSRPMLSFADAAARLRTLDR